MTQSSPQPEAAKQTTPPSERPQRVVTIQRVAADPRPPPPTAPTLPPAGRSGCFWILVGVLVILLVVVLGIVGTVLVGITSLGNITSGFEAMFIPPEPIIQTTSTQTIVTNIQAMGQLVTISAQMAKADIDVAIRQGVLGANSFTTKHVAQGTIQAGIDLTLITPENVKHDTNTDSYTILLPAAGLTNCSVDYIRQYDYAGTVLPVDRDEARLLANHVALLEFRDDALDSGLLDRAEQQAALVFANVIETITNKPVEVTFSDEPPALPPNCEPELPGRWTYDSTTQTWTRPE